MPSSGMKWDPYDVLVIEKSQTTCYGWAPSQNRPCQNRVSQENRQEARLLLQKMSTVDPRAKGLHACLQDVARRILCLRNHQGQAGAVVGLWEEKIERFLGRGEEGDEDDEEEEDHTADAQVATELGRLKAVERMEQQFAPVQRSWFSTPGFWDVPCVNASSSRAASSESQSSGTRSSNSAVSTSIIGGNITSANPPALRADPQRSIDAPPAARCGEEPSDSVLEVAQSAPQTSTTDSSTFRRILEHSASSATPITPLPSERETPIDRPADANSQRRSSLEALTTEPASPEAEPEQGSVALLSSEPSSKPCKPAVEQQKPNNAVANSQRSSAGECPICYEDLLSDEKLASCQAQCRQYFHRECIETWLLQKEAQTCPYCRSDWIEDSHIRIYGTGL